jgi:hypothetical protein
VNLGLSPAHPCRTGPPCLVKERFVQRSIIDRFLALHECILVGPSLSLRQLHFCTPTQLIAPIATSSAVLCQYTIAR